LPLFRYAIGALALIAWDATQPAHAHMKWFASFDVNEAPNRLAHLASASFLALILAALAVLWVVTRIEHSKTMMQSTRSGI